jgi:excisionase family DNA binding protein
LSPAGTNVSLLYLSPPRRFPVVTHISVQDAAKRLSVSPDTIRRAIKANTLKAVKLTPQITRINVKHLEQWAAN